MARPTGPADRSDQPLGSSSICEKVEYDPNTDTLWGAINDGPATWYRD
jgi:hypothetical protein